VIDEAFLELVRPIVREEVARALQRERDRWRWASVRQASERLDMSQSAIYNRIRRGQLPHKKLDGRVFIDMTAVDRILDRL